MFEVIWLFLGLIILNKEGIDIICVFIVNFFVYDFVNIFIFNILYWKYEFVIIVYSG